MSVVKNGFILSDDCKTIIDANVDINTKNKIIIPEGIEFIYESAFSGNGIVQEIVLPSTLKEIQKCAFEGCTDLKKIYFSNSKNLKKIGREAFARCNNLKEIKLPEGLESIGVEAFEECISLKGIYIPSTVRIIHGAPCAYCSDLEKIEISKDNKRYSDMGCNIIYDKSRDTIFQASNTAVLPEGTQNISDSAFAGLSLKTITLPESLKYIARFAFHLTNFDNIIFNENLEMIEDYAFAESGNSITELKLPSSVKLIGEHTFALMDSLKTIHIPQSVESIDRTFECCKNLETVYYFSNCNLSLSNDPFSNCPNLKNIYTNKNPNEIFLKDFIEKYKDNIKPLALEDLIEMGKSIKEINKILKNIEEKNEYNR